MVIDLIIFPIKIHTPKTDLALKIEKNFKNDI